MSNIDYGAVVKKGNKVIYDLYDGYRIYNDDRTQFIKVYKNFLRICNVTGKDKEDNNVIDNIWCPELFEKRKGKEITLKLMNKDIIIKALNKYTDCSRFLLKYNDITILFGYGIAWNELEFQYLSTPKKYMKTYWNNNKNDYVYRLSKRKERPYGWTDKETKYYKKFYYKWE